MDIINWLLEGDISIAYQVQRDILNNDLPELKDRIATEGFGKKFLDCQNENGHWGLRFYQPKWIGTHYTLLDLRHLNINVTEGIKKAISLALKEFEGLDWKVKPLKSTVANDICINGMVLNYMSYFKTESSKLENIIDYIISQQLKDGGFNCDYTRHDVTHSSLHSTLSVLEGIRTYINKNYSYRINELLEIEKQGIEFILSHKLFKSDKTDEIISSKFTMLSYPSRWKYDILRALDYLRDAKVPYDSRIEDALDLLISKRRKNGTWPVQAKHSGQVHFDMEKTGSDSRWNTLRALRVLKYHKKDLYKDLI